MGCCGGRVFQAEGTERVEVLRLGRARCTAPVTARRPCSRGDAPWDRREGRRGAKVRSCFPGGTQQVKAEIAVQGVLPPRIPGNPSCHFSCPGKDPTQSCARPCEHTQKGCPGRGGLSPECLGASDSCAHRSSSWRGGWGSSDWVLVGSLSQCHHLKA